MQGASCIYYSAVPSLRCINIAIARAFRKGDWRSGYLSYTCFWVSSNLFFRAKSALGGTFRRLFCLRTVRRTETRTSDLYGERLRPVHPDCNTFATPDRLK